MTFETFVKYLHNGFISIMFFGIANNSFKLFETLLLNIATVTLFQGLSLFLLVFFGAVLCGWYFEKLHG